MTRILLTIFAIVFFTTAFGQKNYCGEYVTNFPAYGMLGETIKLNCDSTAILNFQGDLMNDNSLGRWEIKNSVLTIYFDTTKTNARYKGTINFKIRGRKLYRLNGLTKELYAKYKTVIDEHNKETGENLKMPTYKTLNQVPKNFYGKTALQYFKKSKSYSCNKQ